MTIATQANIAESLRSEVIRRQSERERSTEALRRAVFRIWRQSVASATRDAIRADHKFCPFRST